MSYHMLLIHLTLQGRHLCRPRTHWITRDPLLQSVKHFTKLAFYEEGEKMGRLLAKIARSQQKSHAIGAIRSSNHQIVNNPEQIISELTSFYIDL